MSGESEDNDLHLLEVVTVQLPTNVSQPVTQDVNGAHFLVESMALQ